MRRGSTPKHTFTLPFNIPDGSVIRVVYAQEVGEEKKVLFVKTGAACEVNANVVTTRLTQEETFLFDCELLTAFIQVRVLTPSDEVIVSDVIRTTVKECLEDEVMCFEEEMA